MFDRVASKLKVEHAKKAKRRGGAGGRAAAADDADEDDAHQAEAMSLSGAQIGIKGEALVAASSDSEDDDLELQAKELNDFLKGEKDKESALYKDLVKANGEWFAEDGEEESDDDDDDEGMSGDSQEEDDEEQEDDEEDGEDDDGETTESEGEGGDDEADAMDKLGNVGGRKQKVVTSAFVDQVIERMEEPRPSAACVKLCGTLLRACVDNIAGKEKESRYIFVSPEVLQVTFLSICTHMRGALDRLLGYSGDAGSGVLATTAPAALPCDGGISRKFAKLRPVVKTILRQIVALLAFIVDDSLLPVVLDALRDLSVYASCFNKLPHLLLKKCLSLWAGERSGRGKEGEVFAGAEVRMAAFLVIRKLALTTPYPFLNFVLKGLYLTYVKACGSSGSVAVSEELVGELIFMEQCVSELYQVDPVMSYQHAFSYIRQMAIHLRPALSVRTRDAVRGVLSVQFLQCLRIWGRILCDAKIRAVSEDANVLGSLVYPLVQLMAGLFQVASGAGAARHAPLLLALVSLMADMSAATGAFVPVASYGLDILEAPYLNKRPVKSDVSAKAVVLDHRVRVPVVLVKSQAFVTAVVERLTATLFKYLAGISRDVAFPEIVSLLMVGLRRTHAKSSCTTTKDAARGLMAAIEANSKTVLTHRGKSGIVLTDDKAVATFLRKPQDLRVKMPLETRLLTLQQQAQDEMS